MSERVVFLRPDAERIARAVRRVEGMREGPPLRFPRVLDAPQSKVFRVCTFTGTWAIDSPKIVTFKNQTTTPNTVIAQNIFAAIEGSTVSLAERNCAIAKDGTSWYVIAAECQSQDQ